jgi:hypothetical protein
VACVGVIRGDVGRVRHDQHGLACGLGRTIGGL